VSNPVMKISNNPAFGFMTGLEKRGKLLKAKYKPMKRKISPVYFSTLNCLSLIVISE